jgi:hypothetical protein
MMPTTNTETAGQRSAIPCPKCGRDIVAVRTEGGEIDREGITAVHLLAARCPYPSCAEPLFAATPSPTDPPDQLLTARALASRQRRRLFVQALDTFFGLAFGLLFVLGPLIAMRAALAEPTCGPGRPLVLFGGTLLALPSALLVAAGIACAIAGWRESRQRFARVAAGALGGMRLAPTPQTYR